VLGEATKDCFAKQLEISDQFSYDFDRYDENKADVLSNSNDMRSKTTKMVRISEDDWKYL